MTQKNLTGKFKKSLSLRNLSNRANCFSLWSQRPIFSSQRPQSDDLNCTLLNFSLHSEQNSRAERGVVLAFNCSPCGRATKAPSTGGRKRTENIPGKKISLVFVSRWEKCSSAGLLLFALDKAQQERARSASDVDLNSLCALETCSLGLFIRRSFSKDFYVVARRKRREESGNRWWTFVRFFFTFRSLWPLLGCPTPNFHVARAGGRETQSHLEGGIMNNCRAPLGPWVAEGTRNSVATDTGAS